MKTGASAPPRACSHPSPVHSHTCQAPPAAVVLGCKVWILPPGALQATGGTDKGTPGPVVSAENTTPSWGAEEEAVTLESANLVL